MADYSYTHLEDLTVVDSDDESAPIPPQMTPKFSLAYLREISDGAILLNLEGRISFLNSAAVRTLSLREKESASGKSWWEVFPDDMEGLLRDALARTVQGEAIRFTTTLGDADTSGKRWDVLTSPVVNQEGEVESVFTAIMPAGRS
jgi:PAS domain-containing protein